MELTVYGPLRSATGSKTVELAVDGETVADVLDAFVDAYPRAAAQLVDDGGTYRPSVRVTVDGETAAFDDRPPAGAEIAIFPAMRGG
ncbi:MAG: ubiquitin-like small modifier protein 1 [Haloarculaceae archaeon]